MSKQVPFEKGDMDWLQGILDGQMDNLLSHGRTERIINRIAELEAQLDDALGAVDSLMMQVEELEAQRDAVRALLGSWQRLLIPAKKLYPDVRLDIDDCIDDLQAALQGESDDS